MNFAIRIDIAGIGIEDRFIEKHVIWYIITVLFIVAECHTCNYCWYSAISIFKVFEDFTVSMFQF